MIRINQNFFYTFFVLLISVFDIGKAQISQYPPESPDSISSCQIDIKCPLGSDLSNLKDAIGQFYYKTDSAGSKYSAYKGTGFLIRRAYNNCCPGVEIILVNLTYRILS